MPSLAFRKASICSRFSFSASCTLVVNPQHDTRSRLILCWKLPPPSGSSCIGQDCPFASLLNSSYARQLRRSRRGFAWTPLSRAVASLSQPFPAGPRSRDPCARLSPAGKQDAGLHPPLLRPFPYSPDAHHGGGANLAHHRRSAQPECRSRGGTALVHDIGHPPFGHAGERTLDLLMRRHGEFFDHNLQALRTVEDLELRYADFPGLNLSFEVREGIVKHSHDYSEAEHPELAEYLLHERPPLEAQLIDFTDEIAYS